MSVTHYRNADEAPVESLLDLFLTVDRDAAGQTYDESTVSMSRALFFDGDDVEPREALRAFYDEFAGEVLVYTEAESPPLGFTMFRSDDPIFTASLPSYEPHLAVTYSGVHPDHRRRGIWTTLRDELYSIARQRGVAYILTGVDKENSVSLAANQSRGLSIVGTTEAVDGAGTVLLLARSVTDKGSEQEE